MFLRLAFVALKVLGAEKSEHFVSCFGARDLTWKSNWLLHFFQSCLGRPVDCVGDAMQMSQNGQMTSNDKTFVACNILDVVLSCSSLSSRVQVSCSTFEEDSEAGDPAFQPSARMPPSSLLLRL